MEFQRFNFNTTITNAIKDAGFTKPTPIQAQAMPHALQGQDIMGLAQTGTGKTAAFVLPILERLMKGSRNHVRAVIIAPTRELAEQIHTSIRDFGRHTKLRSVTVYGGVSIRQQIQKLRAGVEIVVACPGRLLDHIDHRTINLSNMEVLVLDEADRMFDMGFLPDIKKIVKHIPAKRQTMMFSATMPDDIRKLAHDILKDPVTVQISHAMPVNTVSHTLYPVSHHLKTELLLALLKHTKTGSVLVFTRTKHGAKRVGDQLKRAGYRAASMQGNLTQNKRQETLDGFRRGRYQILVATDIASRGIDISNISHVINYDMPDNVDAYTHRIGRTGRAAKTGDAFTFITRADEVMVKKIERVLRKKIDRRQLEDFDYKKSASGHDADFKRESYEEKRGPKQHRRGSYEHKREPKQHSESYGQKRASKEQGNDFYEHKHEPREQKPFLQHKRPEHPASYKSGFNKYKGDNAKPAYDSFAGSSEKPKAHKSAFSKYKGLHSKSSQSPFDNSSAPKRFSDSKRFKSRPNRPNTSR
ncbi:MAG: DEAD/DEAH box helicase [Nitrospiraceae bacterium]|nr:DEAD/DEAH box helicase [Nitrospiraceae bacterium]